MTTTAGRTLADIANQAETTGRTLHNLAQADIAALPTGANRYVFTGCGSSYYAALASAALLEHFTSAVAIGVPSSEIWLTPDHYLRPGSVVVGISRTGTTTEVVKALSLAKERGLSTCAISMGLDVPLYDYADCALRLSDINEQGRVMTQSFSNLLLAGQWLAAQVGSINSSNATALSYKEAFPLVPGALQRLIPEFEQQARSLAERRLDQYVFLGSGPHVPVCADSSLKVQEMSQLRTSSYAVMEYRHGPIADLTAETLVLLLSTPESVMFDRIVTGDVMHLGAQPVVIGPMACLDRLPEPTVKVVLPSDVPSWLYGNIALPFLQYLAYYTTVIAGRNPEAVHNLDKFTVPHIDPHIVDIETVS